MERRALNVRLTPESVKGWEDFCAREGVTLTAILEVVGRSLAEGSAVTDDPAYRQSEAFARIIAEARRLTAESRRRRPRG